MGDLFKIPITTFFLFTLKHGVALLSYLLALHAADHDEVVALLALDHLALHLLESVRQRGPGEHARLDRLTVNAL